jgi:hypothetical protein
LLVHTDPELAKSFDWATVMRRSDMRFGEVEQTV